MRRELGPIVRLDASSHLYDQHPDSQVTVGDDHDGKNEVEEDDGDCVRRASRLLKRTWINPRIILQWAHEQIGHDGEHCQRPDQEHITHWVFVAVQLIILEAVAYVTVTVYCDAGDVENGADYADAHQEAADLAMHVSKVPAPVKYGSEDERIRIDGHHQVRHGQTDHKDVT